MFCDYHVHTYYSEDSEYEMEKCILDAIDIGIDEICITDHVDYGIKKDHDDMESKVIYYNVDYPRYFDELDAMISKYQQIVIKKGCEFGIQRHTIPLFKKLFDAYPFDFILLSIHQVDDKEFWNYEFQEGHSEHDYYQAYYEEMLYVISHYHDYSVLAHMDMLKRYDDKDGYDSFHEHLDIIKEILEKVIQDGKGLELNTSFIRYGLDDMMPARELLQLYYDLGGRILTIGSDSHNENDLRNGHIEELKSELKAIGFTHFTTFSKMQPQFHLL